MNIIADAGIQTEILPLADYTFSGCVDCGYCSGLDVPNCSQDDSYTNEFLPRMVDTDVVGYVFASPVYFGGMSSQLKAFFDRSVVFRRTGFRWENLLAGALSVGRSRHGGQELTEMEILRSALIHGMIALSDAAPTAHFGANLWSGYPAGIREDSAGIRTAENLGKKMVSIARKMYG
ncbi:multimeric flavodoxin WrbA [Chitinivibrio alkaliphilus ACht1]|uniref:Multimeric flavodoxin WrbA n=1 Tax=Chitinivibrio alkaliphilus ACht1 TaxID=1313304 RepID=U7D9T8_9BACT|nr:multimeric flavodoxin WrbA [Chitinivibrio alkaliphilus ACht1]